MFTRNDSNQSLSALLAGLAITVAVAFGALIQVVVNAQSFV
jgi:hypothetical protein